MNSLTVYALDSLLTFDQKQEVVAHLLNQQELYYILYYDYEYVEGIYKPNVCSHLYFTKEECGNRLIELVHDYKICDENDFNRCMCDEGEGFATPPDIYWTK